MFRGTERIIMTFPQNIMLQKFEQNSYSEPITFHAIGRTQSPSKIKFDKRLLLENIHCAIVFTNVRND